MRRRFRPPPPASALGLHSGGASAISCRDRSQVPADLFGKRRDAGRIARIASRPVERELIAFSPRKHVHMEVHDRLPRGHPVRLNQTEPRGPECLPNCQAYPDQGSGYRGELRRRHVENGWTMRFRDHETVAVIGRVEVHEGQRVVVLKQPPTGGSPGDDRAENATRNRTYRHTSARATGSCRITCAKCVAGDAAIPAPPIVNGKRDRHRPGATPPHPRRATGR